MKPRINKIVLHLILNCCLLFIVLDALPQSKISTINQLAEQAFAKENFEQTRNFLFSSVSLYKRQNDSIGLTEIWSKISIVNTLLMQRYHAKAALKIARSYASAKNNDYLVLAEAFNNRSIHLNIEHGSPIHNTHDRLYDRLQSMLRYYKLYKDYDRKVFIENTRIIERELNRLINENTLQQDTLWFGYRNMLFEKGKLLFNKGDFLNCLGYFKRTIGLSEKLKAISQESLMAWSFIFNACHNIRNADLAEEYLNKMVKVYENGCIDASLLGDYYWIKGQYFYILGNYQETLNAIKLCNKFNDFYSYRSLFLIETYFYNQEYQKVIDLDSKYLGTKDAYYNTLLAYSYLITNHIAIARTIERTIDKQKLINMNNSKNHILLILYKYYIKNNQFKKAEFYLNIYLEKQKKHYGEHSFIVAAVYGYLGNFQWIYKNNIYKALQYYQKELSIYLREPCQNDVFKLPDIAKLINHDNLVICLRNKGEAFLELSKTCDSKTGQIKYLKACIDHFDLAFKALNKYKFALLSEEKKLLYTNKTRHYYSYVIDACYRLYELTGEKKYANAAFEYIESSKASVLLSIIKGSGAKKLNMVPNKIIDTENYIRDNTEKYTKQVVEENNKIAPDYTTIDRCNDILLDLSKQQNALLSELKLHHPAYYKLKYGAEVVGIESMQHKLTTNQVLLQYALTNTMLYSILVSKTTYKVVKVPIDENFFTQIEKYRTLISGYAYSDTRDNAIYNYADLAYDLYTKLIAPFNDLITGRELIIIPDDVLNAIPFEPLVTQKVSKIKNISYRDLPYLIKQHPIIYNYSASLLAHTPAVEKSSGQKARLLALAPIDAEFTLSNIYTEDTSRDSNSIAPIPGTVEEVKNVHNLFGGKLLLGKQATEGKLKTLSNQYDIIHIASHGFVNNNYPLYSKLVFHPEKDSMNDGLLNTYEIYGMQMSASLVVLSACNTGYGKLYKGEGNVSLARGFYVAGARNILMTLWSITDKTSNKLVEHFYTHLAQHETVPVSLQRAKLNFIQHADEISAHPFFWAGYISVGEPDVKFLNLQRNRCMHIIGSALVVVMVVGLVYFLKKTKKSGQNRTGF